MTDFGNSLYQKASQIFDGLVESDRKLKRLRARLRDGTSYFDANDYAVRLGELLSKALNDSTDGLAFISEEVAQELLEPLLTQDHNLIGVAIEQIQRNMNDMNGVGLSPMIPEIDMNRIEGLVKKVASGDLEQTRWVLGEPIINYSMSVVDDGVHANARATSKIGLTAKIVRKAEKAGTFKNRRGVRYTVPCKWCRDLEGTYDYADVSDRGNDVYRKHEGCRCQVTYVNGTRRVDTWTHAEWTEEQSAQRAEIVKAKTAQLAEQKRQEAARRKKNLSEIDYVSVHLGYSAKGARSWLNLNRKYINKNGLDYMIDQQRNRDKLAQSRS